MVVPALISDSDMKFEIELLGWECYPADKQGRIPEQPELWDKVSFVVFSSEWVEYEARVVYRDIIVAVRGTMEMSFDIRPLLSGLEVVAKGKRKTWCFEPMEPAFRLIFGCPDVKWRSVLGKTREKIWQNRIVDVFAGIDSEFHTTGQVYGGEDIGVLMFLTGQQVMEFRDALQQALNTLEPPPQGVIRREDIKERKRTEI